MQRRYGLLASSEIERRRFALLSCSPAIRQRPVTDSAFLLLPEAQRAALEAAYATPTRAYHNVRHVEEVLRHFDAAQDEAGWARPVDVRLAVLYHDAIYEPGRKDNEARSADLAREHLQRWPQLDVDVDRVVELILLTARHGQLEPGSLDRDAAQFLDCDMAILGSEPATDRKSVV